MSDDINGLVLDHQVLTDHWPMKAGDCTTENGEFVAYDSWKALSLERQDNAVLAHDLSARPTWELSMGFLALGVLVGYLWNLLRTPKKNSLLDL